MITNHCAFNMAAIKSASSIFYLADRARTKDGVIVSGNTQSGWNEKYAALRSLLDTGQSVFYAQMSSVRHGGKTNSLFLDGHVETHAPSYMISFNTTALQAVDEQMFWGYKQLRAASF